MDLPRAATQLDRPPAQSTVGHPGLQGVASNYLVSLEVTGRRSGRTIALPVVVAVVAGERYLVSMLGEGVQWVQNVRAAGGKATLRSGGRQEILLEEVAAEQRAPGARPHIPVNKDAPLAEFARVAAAFPVFRVVSQVSPHIRVPEQPVLSR